MMNIDQRLKAVEQRLQALQPSYLNIVDEGHKHKGHAGAATGMSHFYIEICADALAKKNRLAQHRAIYAALDDLIGTELHAVRISVLDSK